MIVNQFILLKVRFIKLELEKDIEQRKKSLQKINKSKLSCVCFTIYLQIFGVSSIFTVLSMFLLLNPGKFLPLFLYIYWLKFLVSLLHTYVLFDNTKTQVRKMKMENEKMKLWKNHQISIIFFSYKI